MLRKSVLTHVLILSLAALLVLPLAGCGNKKIENPYENVTLAGALSGESEHKLFMFELDQPEILSVEGNLALLREEDRIEFLVADDLNLLTTLETGYKLGVHREFGTQPEVYLVLEHVVDGPDTSFVTADEMPSFPSYQSQGAFNGAAYSDLEEQLTGMSAAETKAMMKSLGRKGEKIWMSGSLSRAEAGGVMRYFIENDQGRFILEGVTPQGSLFLKALLKSEATFECAGVIGKLNNPRMRRETGVSGPLTLEHFRFQEYVITNG